MYLRAQRLFDGRTAELVEDALVRIVDGKIVAIGHTGDAPPDAELTDLGDVTLIPGLIDVHQHLAFDASIDPVAQLQADDDATLLLRMRLAALRALAVGITTIRDLGDRNYVSLSLRDWFNSGGEVGPRLLCAGPPLTVTNGHCWFLGGVADGVDGVRAAVRERVERGADVIKIMATGGNMTPTVGPHESQYGVAELAAAVEEAHAHGRKLAVHAHGSQGVIDALAVGVDSIEHCTFFNAEGVDTFPDVLEELAASGITISATGATLPGGQPPPAIAIRIDAVFGNMTTLLRSGARVVLSSDAGIAPSKPHDVLPHGLSEQCVRLGMTTLESLVSVTSAAAEACGIDDVTGTLDVGKDADIVAVAGNPLEDINAIHDVVAVFARGNRVTQIGRRSPPTP